MSRPRIKWSARGMVTFDVPRDLLKAALQAIDSERHTLKTAGAEIELMAIELRARGTEVVVEIDPRCKLRHHGCGQTYAAEQWDALPQTPGAKWRCEIGNKDVDVVVHTRQCTGCGSHITLGSLELVQGSSDVSMPRSDTRQTTKVRSVRQER